MSKALFEKGEEVVITERSSSNGFKPTVTTGNVKEMCGTHNVAVRTTGGKDRIVNVKYVQRVEDTIKRLERTDNEFSDFCERLSTLVPIPMAIPLGAARRKHWFVFARALYELK